MDLLRKVLDLTPEPPQPTEAEFIEALEKLQNLRDPRFFKHVNRIFSQMNDELKFNIIKDMTTGQYEPGPRLDYLAHVLSCCTVQNSEDNHYTIDSPEHLRLKCQVAKVIEVDPEMHEGETKKVTGNVDFFYKSAGEKIVILEGKDWLEFDGASGAFMQAVDDAAGDIDKSLERVIPRQS